MYVFYFIHSSFCNINFWKPFSFFFFLFFFLGGGGGGMDGPMVVSILYIHHSVTLTSENPFLFFFFFFFFLGGGDGWSHGSKYKFIYTQINKNIFTDTSVYMLDKICSFAVDLVLTIFIIQNVLINAQWEQTRMLIDRKKKFCLLKLFRELESRIIAAALELLKITRIGDIPADQALPFNLVNENKKRKKLFIQKLPSKIVDIEVYFLKVEDLESFQIMKQKQTIELYKQFV